MNRREALKTVGAILGGTIISGSSFLACSNSRSKEGKYYKEDFSKSDIKLLDEIAETIIPVTDIPGAKAADVGSFMAMMVPDCYTQKNQESFHKGLDKIRNDFHAKFGTPFINGKLKERRSYLNHLDGSIVTYNKTKKQGDPAYYFSIIKELVLLGYFTSEIGCTQARRYVLTPGRYEACIPYKGKRAWTVDMPGSS
jgi:hypothetical protein